MLYLHIMGGVLQSAFKIVAAYVVCAPALLMPYRVRVGYILLLSRALHTPFAAFGKIARVLLARLHIAPLVPIAPEAKKDTPHAEPERVAHPVAVLFSGGTDSTCAAALMANTRPEVHLLTFYEHATRSSPIPTRNIENLKAHFPQVAFIHRLFPIDDLVRHFSYERYLRNIREFGLLVLATPGFSSLSWHTRAIQYCLENGITEVVDGLTRELMHFPGHMDAVIEDIRALYRDFGIIYANPVREWPTPPDQQFIDRVLVNRHEDFLFGDTVRKERGTTGQYLFDIGLLPAPNVKGSRMDHAMQHDCYPFALYNIMAFWGVLSASPYELFENKVAAVMREKIGVARSLVAARYPAARVS